MVKAWKMQKPKKKLLFFPTFQKKKKKLTKRDDFVSLVTCPDVQ